MTMFCPDEERLSAWVDRGLTPTEDEFVSTHLAACEECRRAVTIAFLVDRESPAALSDAGQRQALQTVQGALAEPSKCVSDELLAAWLHDGLEPADRAPVTEHMSECDDCRRAAALARLSNTEPVSALGEAQEERALKLVLKSAGRDVFFSFWRVAAASLLVAIAVTYTVIQWAGLPAPAPVAVKPPVEPGGHKLMEPNKPGSASASVSSPDIEPAPKSALPTPERRAPEPVVPARYQHLQIFESEGLASDAPGRLSYGDVLRPRKGVASVNVEGRALVVLDEGSESRVAYATDAGAYFAEIIKGRVFIDTAGTQQNWEIRSSDRVVTLRSFRGRAVAESDSHGLRVHLLKGAADVGPNNLEAGRRIEVQPDASVTVEMWPEACATLAERYVAIRPRYLLLLRGAAGRSSNDGPWRYVSPSKEAKVLGGAIIPECSDEIRWIEIALDEPLKFTSDMELKVACSGTGTKLYLWAGGSAGWHLEVARQTGTTAETWSLRGLRRDMVPIVAGEEIRKIMIGVVQERGREYSLEVDEVEIRRVLD